ncbi:M42 family metallopeptidase [Allofustis seminis]|uniref:M42 family metallopeptidase n=1 Tax=Allofustis seminis TaxID=166939 RepID=UPI0012EA8131|nr:M42 family metallopeptidase [Allofustis seminis]
MSMKDDQLLMDLVAARAVPGNEKQAREVFVNYAKDFADEILYDGLGSVIAKLEGPKGSPKIMFAGHLDEVGFMVKAITDEGFIEFQTLGGWWGQVLLAQQVEITTRAGNIIHGVIGSKPPHVLSAEARKTPYEISKMFIDVGASSKEEVEGWGIRAGDMVTPYIEYRRLNHTKFLLAKAWDNRIGTAVALRVLENLKDTDHPNIPYAVGNVQEEVGLRGAKTSTNVIQPDISFALDTGTAGDTPGMTKEEADSKLGKGPQIVLFDASMIAHKELANFVIDVADELGIPYQLTFIPGGGTDAGSQHVSGTGVPSLPITVATRYLHSHTSIIHEDDFENTVKLMTEVIKRLDKDTVEKIIHG